ncbi:MAG TPA: ribonuclease HII [Negativicutes bacterium]|nr:ribonuclease HII [Negativicutes bacterium]
MANGRMTVTAAAEALAAETVAPEILELLAADPRAAVARLMERRRRRQAAMAAEEARLEKLFEYEKKYYDQGCRLVAGVDEAGRGPLAGPVVVGAVILSPGCRLTGLDDSKKLTADEREALYVRIKEKAVAVSHAVIGVEDIDRINIYQATVKGMYAAVAALAPAPGAVLVDAVPLRLLPVPHQAIIGGDALSASIAAASIIAKVERDRIMAALDREYPDYGFARHKGYGTPEHLAALRRCGPCAVHRRSFAPVRGEGSLFDED